MEIVLYVIMVMELICLGFIIDLFVRGIKKLK